MNTFTVKVNQTVPTVEEFLLNCSKLAPFKQSKETQGKLQASKMSIVSVQNLFCLHGKT